MAHPVLTEQQTAQALQTYITAREQAVRFVLAALDPTAYNAPALPYPEVLARVHALIATEMEHYAEPATNAPEPVAPVAESEEPAHG